MTPKVKNDNFISSLCSFVWKHRKSEQSLKKSNIICGRTWTFNIEMQFSFTKGTREFLFWQMRDRLSPICTNWTTATLSLADCCAASALKMIDLQYVKKYHLQRAQQMWWYNAPLWFTVRKSNYVEEMKDWWHHAGLSILFSSVSQDHRSPYFHSLSSPDFRRQDQHISNDCTKKQLSRLQSAYHQHYV